MCDNVSYCGRNINHNELYFRITNFHSIEQNIIDFKKSLFLDGPCYFAFHVYGDFLNFWYHDNIGQVYRRNSINIKGSHAVLLIGYDDNKQAFLCKNSWGGNNGPNRDGTFWISYNNIYD